jgi:hypothetical protein
MNRILISSSRSLQWYLLWYDKDTFEVDAAGSPRKIDLVFFRNESGGEPVTGSRI